MFMHIRLICALIKITYLLLTYKNSNLQDASKVITVANLLSILSLLYNAGLIFGIPSPLFSEAKQKHKNDVYSIKVLKQRLSTAKQHNRPMLKI